VVYGILYLLFTTFTFVFEEHYHFSSSNVGLSYIGSGIGMFIGLILTGTTSDRILKRLTAANNGQSKPEFRLPPLIFLGVFMPIGLFIYGWTAQYHVQWAVPMLGTLFFGIGLISCLICIQTYLIDTFTMHAASAMAANTLLRSILGGLLPLAGLDMYDALGLGWGNSLIGFVAFAMLPIPVAFYFYGEKIRNRFPVKL
jgi:MFS family permease